MARGILYNVEDQYKPYKQDQDPRLKFQGHQQ